MEGHGPITGPYAHHLLATGAARAPEPIPDGTKAPTPAQQARHDPPAWLDASVRARDGTCRFPGCRRTARRCDLDHTIRYPDGPTVAANLGALCRRHHGSKHNWEITQHDDATFTWQSKITGRSYRTHPRGTTGNWTGTDHLD